MMPTRRPRTKEEDHAAAYQKVEMRWANRKPLGRPSLALETMCIIHYLTTTRLTGTLTQAALKRATAQFYAEQRARTGSSEWFAPSANTLKLCVRAYILYRQGRAARASLPAHIRRALDALPGSIHADQLAGSLGAFMPDLVLGPRAHALIDSTQRLFAIPSLPSPHKLPK